jgi:acyl-CoA thioesterase I
MRHGVLLVPKRVLIGILTVDGATVDSIHLSRRGHELMSETVWKMIGRVVRP